MCSTRRGELQPAALHVVYGHGGEQVREAFAAEPVQWVLQAEQKRHRARRCCRPCRRIPDSHRVLVLYGDVPLLQAQTLRELLALASPDSRWRC